MSHGVQQQSANKSESEPAADDTDTRMHTQGRTNPLKGRMVPDYHGNQQTEHDHDHDAL